MASVQFRPQNRDLGMVMREVDEDLAIYLGLRDGEERNDHLLIDNSDDFDGSMRVECDQIVADDNLLSLEIECNDYDWLTPEKVDLQDSAMNQTNVSKDETLISSKSELAKTGQKSATSITSKNVASRRSSSSSGDRKPAPRASTPTVRPSLPAKPKPSRSSTPTSRTTSEHSRASSRATLISSRPVANQARSSTPLRAASRPSTPTSRPTLPARSKSASRSATTTSKPATTSATSTSSDGRKAVSVSVSVSKRPLNPPARGSSQIVKSRPSKSSDTLSLSHEHATKTSTSMPKRPASASRGRAKAHSSSSNGKPRQKSCSPARARPTNGHKMLSRSQGYGHSGGDEDDVNPVLMGTMMVERVVNMRKLAPPKQDEHISHDKPKKSSMENTGFGRSLSKRSLDMAIRHMDIRRSINIPDNLSPVATGTVSSSTGSCTQSSSESPLTSTSDSSNSTNSYFLDE